MTLNKLGSSKNAIRSELITFASKQIISNNLKDIIVPKGDIIGVRRVPSKGSLKLGDRK